MGAQGIRLFIAEDHVAIREVLAAYLASVATIHIVGQATDGLSAIKLCLELKPDVVLLDIDMPGLNGISVARKLTAEIPDTQILIFTSHHDGATVRQAIEAGARGMIEKTGPVDALLKAIEAVAEGRSYFGSKIAHVLQHSMLEPSSSPLSDQLTGREREILQLVAEGYSNKELCTRLGISLRTVENHRHNLMRKLGAHNSADLTREAFRMGMIRNLTPPLQVDESADSRPPRSDS